MTPLEQHRQECDAFEVSLMTSISLCAFTVFALVALMAFGVL